MSASILDPAEVEASRLIDAAKALLASHPDVGNETIRQLEALLLDADSYPELIVTKLNDDEDPELGTPMFVCPWCGDDCDPVMVDSGTWDTRVTDLDFDKKTYSPGYDHEPEMSTQYVKSSCCQKPVRVPADWETE